MTFRRALLLGAIAAVIAPAGLLARQNILLNGSVEFGQGAGAIDQHVPDQWTTFGVNVERSDAYNLVPPGSGHALKSFGDGDNTSAGAYQVISNIVAGQSVTASVQLFSPANDKLRGSGQAGLVLEFLNQFGGTIALNQIYPLDVNSPADTWMLTTLGPFTAPANTNKVRVTCRLQWSLGNVLGAAYWDDAQLTVNGGSNKVLNGDFETAGHSTGQSPYGIDQWIGFGDQQKSTDVAKDGSASLKLGIREAFSGLYQNMAVLQAGDHLYLQAFVWNPSSDPLTADSLVGIKLEFSPNGDTPPPIENLPFDASAPIDTWVPVSLSAVVPPEATIARVDCSYV